jgi:epoxyqueuosine reductase
VPSDNSTTRKKRRIVSGPLPGGDTYWQHLNQIGHDAGLYSMGVASVEPLLRARDQIRDRIERDLINEMQFTFRNPERSTTPSLTVEGARSIIVGTRSYYVADPDEPNASMSARIARYAWVDHQEELKNSLRVVMKKLRDDGHRAVVFADDNSIVDREVAHRAGIGWFGKNANILLPGAGSFFVIGCIVTTAELPIATPVDDACGTCTRCMPACPTDAIASPGVIDANRCLSWLLQKPGVFDSRFREALGNRIYGCDDCQTSCPHTQRWSVPVSLTSVPRRSLDVEFILTATDDELMKHVDGWYVHDRNPVWVRRNALIIMGNVADPRSPAVVLLLQAYLSSPEPVLRAHAVWAAARLGLFALLPSSDDNEMVRSELSRLPALRGDL